MTGNPFVSEEAKNAKKTAFHAVKPLRFAFYGRCSTDDNQDPETSRLWQLRVARALVVGSGGEIVLEFFDVGYSRSLPWSRRPQANAILEELGKANRRFDAVVVGEGQRCFYGSQFSDVAPRFQHFGVELWLPELSGAFDPDNTTQDMLMTITGGMSKGERKRIQERVKQGMAAQIETEGRWLGGRPPYGYKAVGWKPHPNPKKASEGLMQKHLEIDPLAAPIIARIFAEALAGRSQRQIARSLNEDGILCPSAHDPERNAHRAKDGWQTSTLSAILHSERYTGYETWGRFKKTETLVDLENPTRGYRRSLTRSDEPLIRSASQTHPAIVSFEDFMSLQALLSSKTAGGNRAMAKVERKSKPSRALQGLIRCSICSRKMVPEPDNAYGLKYRCRSRDLVPGSAVSLIHPASIHVREHVLLPLVTAWVKTLFSFSNREHTIDLLTGSADLDSTAKHANYEATSRKLAEAKSKLRNLQEAIIAGVPPAAVVEPITKAQVEIDALNLALETLPIQVASARQDVERLVDLYAGHLDQILNENADPAKVNALLDALGLTMVYDHAEKRIAAVLQPKTTIATLNDSESGNPLGPEGSSARVREGSRTPTP